MRLADEPETPLAINVVPLIDVMFALLTFFMVSTLSLTRSEGLQVNLPQASTAKAQPSAPITVTINAQGQLALNRKAIQLEALDGEVRQLVKPNQEVLVIVNADQAVNHGQVVAVMDRLRQVPGTSLAIATQTQ